MTISEKLALDFIKNHSAIKLDDDIKKTSMTRYDIVKAYVDLGSIKLYLFKTSCGNTMYMHLPYTVKPNHASLADMLKCVAKYKLNLYAMAGTGCELYMVTSNRLRVLEELMKNSGLNDADQTTFKFDTAKAMIEDESGNTIEALNQANLSDIDGVIIDGVKYYPALEVEKLCYKADKLYTSLKREYDNAKKEYDKTCRSIDPTFVEAQSKMLQLAKDLSVTSLQTINTIIDKLTENVQKVSKN